MDYRHEWKSEINKSDLLTLRMRMRAIMKRDSHAVDGNYRVRSLYFDTWADTALREKLEGVNVREKFRIRCYNGDTGMICLEKKSKWNNLSSKQRSALTPWEAQAIVDGRLDWMKEHPHGLVREFYVKTRTKELRPRTIVDYTREPFVYAPGNTRVTFDYDIRTGLGCTDFLNPDCIMIPAGDAPVILEVKWDAFLPDIIRDAVQLPGRPGGAFSKYAQCRIYG